MKACMKCGQTKPLSEFYAHQQMADGRLNKCKTCTIADTKAHRRDPRYRDRVLAYDRKRGDRRSPESKAAWQARNAVSTRARSALARAVRSGAITPAANCEHCGIAARLHGHHHDYSKPLAVVWLCVACHRQHHAMMDLIEKRMKETA